MEYTAYHSLADLVLSVGPNRASTVRLRGPILLQVEFSYEAPLAPRQDDPGAPEFFDFKRVVTPYPLVLTSNNGSRRFVICSGDDLYEDLTPGQLAAIEADLIERHHGRRLDTVLDQALLARVMAGLEAAQ